MTQQEMAKQLAYLSSATGKKFEKGDVVLWHDLLKDLPDASVTAAVQRYARERKDFPTVADIRQYASEAQVGALDEPASAFDRVCRAIRRYGYNQPTEAKASLDELTWQAVGSCGGWNWACELSSGNRQTYAAQFRMAYQALASREERHRRIPGALRPGITNGTAMVSLPAPEPVRVALPAPPRQPTAEEVERAKLFHIFRDPEEKPVELVSEADIDLRKRQGEAWLKRKIAEADQ